MKDYLLIFYIIILKIVKHIYNFKKKFLNS